MNGWRGLLPIKVTGLSGRPNLFIVVRFGNTEAGMNKAVALRIVNMALLFSFTIQAVTGIIMSLGIKTHHARLIFEIHEHNGLLMIIIVAMHIALNWGWIRANFLKKR